MNLVLRFSLSLLAFFFGYITPLVAQPKATPVELAITYRDLDRSDSIFQVFLDSYMDYDIYASSLLLKTEIDETGTEKIWDRFFLASREFVIAGSQSFSVLGTSKIYDDAKLYPLYDALNDVYCGLLKSKTLERKLLLLHADRELLIAKKAILEGRLEDYYGSSGAVNIVDLTRLFSGDFDMAGAFGRMFDQAVENSRKESEIEISLTRIAAKLREQEAVLEASDECSLGLFVFFTEDKLAARMMVITAGPYTKIVGIFEPKADFLTINENVKQQHLSGGDLSAALNMNAYK